MKESHVSNDEKNKNSGKGPFILISDLFITSNKLTAVVKVNSYCVFKKHSKTLIQEKVFYLKIGESIKVFTRSR